MIKAVLFDLDGTLLPMDNDIFTKGYFGAVAKKLAPHGYKADELIDGIWYGTGGMVKNNGVRTNEEVFWEMFAQKTGERVLADRGIFDEFYRVEFDTTKQFCGYDELASESVRLVKEKGMRAVLATSPIFPDLAVSKRAQWAGVNLSDFELYTSYENSSYCKPNPDYYTDIVKRLGLSPSECLMVGNDVDEDMLPAKKAGLEVFLLSDNLINRKKTDISSFTSGGFRELMDFLDTL